MLPPRRNLNAFRSERVVITIKRETRHKVLQVVFARDGSFFVTCPYFRHRIGLLSSSTIPATGQQTSQIDMKPGGKVASHLVKYAHHVDGEAHFSQDGKIRTLIRRRSVRLDEHNGHIFTVMLRGLRAFEAANAGRDQGSISPQRTVITFDIDAHNEERAIKLVGRWYHVDAINPEDQSFDAGPVVSTVDPHGVTRIAALLANPTQETRHVLLVTCEEIQPLSGEPEMLMFYGGFDHKSVMTNASREAGFLAFSYPIADAETLRRSLGTVDFQPPGTTSGATVSLRSGKPHKP